MKRQDDGLNLKTPAGPQPHPSWVYRHNYAQFNPQQQHQHPNAGGNFVSRRDSISTGANPAAIVKRSLSLLNRTRATKSEGRAAAGNNTNGNHHQATTDRLELLSKQLNGTGGNRGGKYLLLKLNTQKVLSTLPISNNINTVKNRELYQI